jgi:glycosyltransferase involved in cell wall biosynthesis
MTEPAPISCYIRTLNEARMIGRVIEAARLLADEVVVVDSGSTDDTVKIAEAAGARVVRQAWLGWGKQKRVGEDACTHVWLLDLDADEIVTPEFAAEARALFANGGPPCPVYKTMLVTAPPIGKPWRDFNLAPRTKLYDKTRIRAPDHEAWDQFKIPPGMQTGRLRAPLLHYSFQDLHQLDAKFNSGSSLSAASGKLKSLWVLALRLILGPPIYFLRFFVGRGLWRGGLYGYVVAAMAAHGRWLRDAKMLERRLKAAEQRRAAKAADAG